MPQGPRTGRRAALSVPAALLFGRPRSAVAASLEIAPVLLELPPARPSAVLNIINAGGTPARLQLRAFGWTQENGQDRLQPTEALLFSPPQFTLAPGESQVARVALRRAPSGSSESAFRLLVDELPPLGGAAGHEHHGDGVVQRPASAGGELWAAAAERVGTDDVWAARDSVLSAGQRSRLRRSLAGRAHSVRRDPVASSALPRRSSALRIRPAGDGPEGRAGQLQRQPGGGADRLKPPSRTCFPEWPWSDDPGPRLPGVERRPAAQLRPDAELPRPALRQRAGPRAATA